MRGREWARFLHFWISSSHTTQRKAKPVIFGGVCHFGQQIKGEFGERGIEQHLRFFHPICALDRCYLYPRSFTSVIFSYKRKPAHLTFSSSFTTSLSSFLHHHPTSLSSSIVRSPLLSSLKYIHSQNVCRPRRPQGPHLLPNLVPCRGHPHLCRSRCCLRRSW